MDDTWVGLWGCRQWGRGLTAPHPVVLRGKASQHPTVPRLAVPMRDHQAPHFPRESLSSRHPGRCGTWTGPLFQWLKKRLCIGGSPACSRGSSSEPSRGVGGDPRPARDPADALGSRLGPHCLSSAICRRRLRPPVLQTHVSLSGSAAGASGGTFPWCDVWKVPHGPGEDWARPRERRACVHIFWRSGSLSPQAQVESCWHFHPFNHRLRETLWEIAASWRSRSEWDGLSPSEAQTARQSLSSGRGVPKPRHACQGRSGVGSFML